MSTATPITPPITRSYVLWVTRDDDTITVYMLHHELTEHQANVLRRRANQLYPSPTYRVSLTPE